MRDIWYHRNELRNYERIYERIYKKIGYCMERDG